MERFRVINILLKSCLLITLLLYFTSCKKNSDSSYKRISQEKLLKLQEKSIKLFDGQKFRELQELAYRLEFDTDYLIEFNGKQKKLLADILNTISYVETNIVPYYKTKFRFTAYETMYKDTYKAFSQELFIHGSKEIKKQLYEKNLSKHISDSNYFDKNEECHFNITFNSSGFFTNALVSPNTNLTCQKTFNTLSTKQPYKYMGRQSIDFNI